MVMVKDFIQGRPARHISSSDWKGTSSVGLSHQPPGILDDVYTLGTTAGDSDFSQGSVTLEAMVLCTNFGDPCIPNRFLFD